MQPREVSQYRLSWLLDADTPSDLRDELIVDHPAAPALQFADAINIDSGLMLASMGDPRWFADYRRPDSMRLMRDLLGVRSIQRANKFLAGDEDFFLKDSLGNVSKMVFSTWNSGKLFGNPQHIVDPDNVPKFVWEKYWDMRRLQGTVPLEPPFSGVP